METKLSTGRETSAVMKIWTGLTVVVLGAVLLGWVTTVGDVRVNAGAIDVNCRRLDRYDAVAAQQAADISDIKADLRGIKVMLERMEKDMEERDR